MSRVFVSGARRLTTVRGPGSKAAGLANLLLAESPEFAALWNQHDVGIGPHEVKRYVHPEVGLLEFDCQTLHDHEQSHVLLIYTAVPGSESYRKLKRLWANNAQSVSTDLH